jgi:hypothetical protein
MDVQETQRLAIEFLLHVSHQFQRVPGSAILVRYIKSSYQNDPVRSAVELFLFLFAVRYLLAPKYSTKPNFVPLTEEVRSPVSDLRCGIGSCWMGILIVRESVGNRRFGGRLDAGTVSCGTDGGG